MLGAGLIDDAPKCLLKLITRAALTSQSVVEQISKEQRVGPVYGVRVRWLWHVPDFNQLLGFYLTKCQSRLHVRPMA